MRSGASKVAALVVAAVVAAAASYAIYAHAPGRPPSLTSGTVGPSNSSYAAAARALEGILADAGAYVREFNLTSGCNLTSEGSLASARVVNETVMLICGRPYRYAILQLYDGRTGFTFAPSQVEAGGFAARLLPNPPNVTYTGGTPYTYLITYDNETYRYTFWITTIYPMTAVYSLGGDVYAVQVLVTYPHTNAFSYAFLVLAPAR